MAVLAGLKMRADMETSLLFGHSAVADCLLRKARGGKIANAAAWFSQR
jgi:hypothetical protein